MELDPGANNQRPADRPPVEAVDDAIRGAFAVLELHRHEAFLLSHSRRAAERYEGRYLVAAIDRLERYLHVAEELTDFEAMRIWVEDVLAEEGAERRRRRRPLASLPRRKARERASARFEAIASDVMAELETALSEPNPEREQSWRCVARTRQGSRCKNPAVEGGLCELHARLAGPDLVPGFSPKEAKTDGGTARFRAASSPETVRLR